MGVHAVSGTAGRLNATLAALDAQLLDGQELEELLDHADRWCANGRTVKSVDLVLWFLAGREGVLGLVAAPPDCSGLNEPT